MVSREVSEGKIEASTDIYARKRWLEVEIHVLIKE